MTAAGPESATDVPLATPELIAALRADLAAAEFTVDGCATRVGQVAAGALQRDQPLPALLATDGATDPCGVLVRLFTLGVPVAAADVDGALPTLGVHGATALGLVTKLAPTPAGGPATPPSSAEVSEGEDPAHAVVATCDLSPYADEAHDWWVASDLSELAIGGPLRTDHVLGIGGASTTLASWTIRRQAGRTLDLGTGCGVQALHLAGHTDSIVATDISERALGYARFNAALAGISLDTRRGDLLDPVVGERFDLVVSNPPFVITPRVDDVPLYEYRDGGRAGDSIVRSLVEQVGGVLAPGGVAQFLGNWEVPRGRTWRDVWADWLSGLDLDALVVQRESQDPAEYAELWARDGGARPGSLEHQQMYAAWLRDFEGRDVESVGFGVVTLQRPVALREPWRSLEEALGPVAAPMGPTIEAGLTARTWLAEHSDADVLDAVWSCAADVTEERHGRPGAEDPAVILVRQGGGLGRVVRADTLLAAYLSVADGELTARVALEAIASLLDADPAEVVASALPQLRDLISDGLLV